jgi:hypothetical protein
VPNTQRHYATELITAVKRFIIQALIDGIEQIDELEKIMTNPVEDNGF